MILSARGKTSLGFVRPCPIWTYSRSSVGIVLDFSIALEAMYTYVRKGKSFSGPYRSGSGDCSSLLGVIGCEVFSGLSGSS